MSGERRFQSGEHIFRKGEAVPHWVLNPTPKERVTSFTFGCDAVVMAGEEGVRVRPLNPPAEGESLLIINSEP